jgi:hypothetical protein
MVVIVGNGSTAVGAVSNIPPSPPGVVKGELRLAGGPPGAKPHALPGHVYVRAHGHRVAAVRVRKNGKFKIRLAAGRYRVVGRSPKYGDNHTPCAAAHRVKVRDSHVTHIDVTCQQA